MAVFENLHDVGLALAGYLRRNLSPALAEHAKFLQMVDDKIRPTVEIAMVRIAT